MTLAFVLLVAWSLACGRAPAPDDVDGLARWFWLSAGEDDAAVADAAARLDATPAMRALGPPLEGGLRRLLPGDAAVVGLMTPDVSRAAGMVVLDVIRCPLDRVERLIAQTDQKALHGGFDRYSRTYTSDAAAYFERRVPRLDWRSEYTFSLLGTSYDAVLPGGLRRVPAQPGFPRGPVVVAHAWLPAPATVNGVGSYFRQDYQVQVLYERAPGEVVHLYALWREMKLAGFDTDGGVLVGETLDKLVAADHDFETHCGS